MEQTQQFWLSPPHVGDWLPKKYGRYTVRFTRPTSTVRAIVYDGDQKVYEVNGAIVADTFAKAKRWIDDERGDK